MEGANGRCEGVDIICAAQNALELLDTAGEFYVDALGGRVLLRTAAGDDPSTDEVVLAGPLEATLPARPTARPPDRPTAQPSVQGEQIMKILEIDAKIDRNFDPLGYAIWDRFGVVLGRLSVPFFNFFRRRIALGRLCLSLSLEADLSNTLSL